MANTARKPQKVPSEEGNTISLNISVTGDRAWVAGLIAELAATLGGQGPQQAPELLLLTREQVMERTGWSHTRITGYVAEGRLTNRGSRRKLLISPQELERLIANQG